MHKSQPQCVWRLFLQPAARFLHQRSDRSEINNSCFQEERPQAFLLFLCLNLFSTWANLASMPRRFLPALFMVAVSLAAQQPAGPVSQQLPPTSDAKEIVRRAIESDQHNFELARKYTCEQREVEKELDKNGNAKSEKTRTYDLTIYYDEVYSRLIQMNDKPLSEKEEKKEQEKLDKFIARRKNESEGERQKRLAKMEKERQEGRAFLRDVLNAYDFVLAGEEAVNGRTAYVSDARPRHDFHPTQPHADILPKD